ncbi:hypothetical protein [Stieleria varia]|nr:hypothetical protein [Stieleria varia]
MSPTVALDELLDRLGVSFFRRETDEEEWSHWLVTTENDCTIDIQVSPTEEVVLLRVGPILELADLSTEQRCRWLSRLMSANERRRLGKFVGDVDVYFEIALSVVPVAQDCEILARVLEEAIGTVAAVAFLGHRAIQ